MALFYRPEFLNSLIVLYRLYVVIQLMLQMGMNLKKHQCLVRRYEVFVTSTDF